MRIDKSLLAIALRLAQVYGNCKHQFRGTDLQPRDKDGKVHWRCFKCGEVFAMDYGLQAPGEIVGPWDYKRQEESNG